jgi:N-acetylglucosaminyldiphosphoundecaprenol N-acetyl-beta-D-mannosaminyltransferase
MTVYPIPHARALSLVPAAPVARMSGRLPSIELEGVRLHALREDQCVDHIMESLSFGRGGWVVTPNLDQLRRLVRDEALRESYARADLSVADGMPLVWASRLQRTPLPERVAGSDLIWSLSAAAAERGRSVYFLGGDPGTAEECASRLAARFPTLKVAGTSCPEVGFEQRPECIAELVAALGAQRPDIVFVALGSPKQEALIQRLRQTLPHAWWLGVGISFSFVAGRVNRAPEWLRGLGLEWAHRLVQEPRRLARRYLVDGLPFGAMLTFRAMLRGLRARSFEGAG